MKSRQTCGIKDVKKPEKISAQTFLLTDSTQPDVINRFFRFLSQQECKADKSTGRFHPDLLFVTRLPASSPSKKSWTVLEVNDALKKLLRRLKTGEDVAAGKKSSTESSNDILIKKNSALLKSVIKEMNYQAWIYTRDYIRVARSLNGSAVSNAGIKKGANIDSTGAWVGNQFLWDVPPAREVNKYIRRFGLNDRSARGWEQAAAKEMVKLLNGWGVAGVVEGDADERPWFVTHCFFQFLSRSGLKQNLPNTALTPWHDQFVQLMPEGPVAVKTSYGTEDDLREDLSKLRLKLKAESSVLVLTLLANCAEKLEYGGWKVRMEDLYGSVNNPPTKTEGSADPRVNAFVERFKKSKED